MSNEEQKSECLSVRISAPLKVRLQHIANMRHMSVSGVAVEALECMVADAEAQGYDVDLRLSSPAVGSKPSNSCMRWLKSVLTRNVKKS